LKYKAKNIYDFMQIWYWELKKIIWKNATDLWLELNWINAFVVKKSKQIKSMSRWRSFNKNITNDELFLYTQLKFNFNVLFEEFINKDFELKSISIFLRDKDFITHIYKYSFNDYTYIRSKIFKIIKILFEDNFSSNNKYRSTWIIFSDFRIYKPYQTTIFDKPLRDKNNYLKLSKTINYINKKYNSHKITYWTDFLWEWKNLKLWIKK
jgi:hypothetical protein